MGGALRMNMCTWQGWRVEGRPKEGANQGGQNMAKWAEASGLCKVLLSVWLLL